MLENLKYKFKLLRIILEKKMNYTKSLHPENHILFLKHNHKAIDFFF